MFVINSDNHSLIDILGSAIWIFQSLYVCFFIVHCGDRATKLVCLLLNLTLFMNWKTYKNILLCLTRWIWTIWPCISIKQHKPSSWANMHLVVMSSFDMKCLAMNEMLYNDMIYNLAMRCHACHAMPHNTMLCRTMSCITMLCCVSLYQAIQYHGM